jgi:hypothetical protein
MKATESSEVCRMIKDYRGGKVKYGIRQRQNGNLLARYFHCQLLCVLTCVEFEYKR